MSFPLDLGSILTVTLIVLFGLFGWYMSSRDPLRRWQAWNKQSRIVRGIGILLVFSSVVPLAVNEILGIKSHLNFGLQLALLILGACCYIASYILRDREPAIKTNSAPT
jgi:hypothetical protein